MIPLWLRLYKFIIMLILPIILNGFLNLLIFRKAHSSTHHIIALSSTKSPTNSKSSCLNARDARLLKQMLISFMVFVIGWGPIYILSVVGVYVRLSYLVYLSLQLLPALSLFINIVRLFFYNHKLRQYLKERIFKYLNFVPNSKKLMILVETKTS
jgi:hypothetical protein